MNRIIVKLNKFNCTVIISSNLFNDSSFFFPLKPGDKTVLVTSKTLEDLYLDKVCQILEKKNIKVDTIVLLDGEKCKSWITLNKIFTELIKKHHGRDTILIALGGGCIGDLTGFAAASYQRGIRFIQIPTTLLSQVDSAIGGKTAINHSLGKNMIGAFHQPESVIINLDCLKTLPTREISSGLAEVIKYGIALDKIFFSWLEAHIDDLLCLDRVAIKYCVHYCCKLKARIVSVDEFENNIRSLLNLGHTFGHAIEAKMKYKNWLHGEAVSVGIVIASRISERLGFLKKEETKRIIMLLKRAGLPIIGPQNMSAKSYFPFLIRDKKNIKNKLRLILPTSIGKSKVYDEVSEETILDILTTEYKLVNMKYRYI